MHDNDQEYGQKSYDSQGYEGRPYNESRFDQGPNFNQGPSGSQGPLGGQGSLGGRGPSGDRRPPKKRSGLLKKAALITAGAALFEGVSGDVMVSIHMAVSRYLNICASADPSDKENGDQPVPGPDNGQMDGKGQSGQGGQGGSGSHEKVPDSEEGGVADVSDIVKAAMPTMVAITSTTVYRSNNYGYGWFFDGPQAYEVPSSGSGIVIGENNQELLIVTNNHVVEGASFMKVAFIDSEVVDAVIKGTDAETNPAVISVPLDQIRAGTKSRISITKLGSSDDLKVGQDVIAIDNALGYGQSVTVGCVSTLDREVRVSNNAIRTLLQTNAAINLDNSRGALLNMKGEVMGIDAARYSSTEVEGIGYTVPIFKTQDIMSQLMNRKTINPVKGAKRGYLEIQGTTVDKETVSLFSMPRGAYVYKVLGNGAAAESDLKDKDIITKVDGQSVKTMTELRELLACYELGEELGLTVQTQENGQYQERIVQATLKSMFQEEQGNPAQ